ncbi:MAG: hypothetical protein GY822_24570 [Deltaproteobacteria bacterium]|nr:hypothetical protein [Deltaproteobacteria bacterium]
MGEVTSSGGDFDTEDFPEFALIVEDSAGRVVVDYGVQGDVKAQLLAEEIAPDAFQHTLVALSPLLNRVFIYQDGHLNVMDSLDNVVPLEQFNDVNIWKGRSNWSNDLTLLERLRILGFGAAPLPGQPPCVIF